MRKVRRRDTTAERALRSRLHRDGFRYRVDARLERSLPYRADIVFRGPRVAVFVDGCFWHGCPQHRTAPRSNAEWWYRKIEGNRTRDETATAALREAGWTVLRFWEHEFPEACAAVIVRVMKERRV